MVRLTKRRGVDPKVDTVREGLDPIQLRHAIHPTRGHLLRRSEHTQGTQRTTLVLVASRRLPPLSQHQLLQLAQSRHVRVCAQLFNRRVCLPGLRDQIEAFVVRKRPRMRRIRSQTRVCHLCQMLAALLIRM